MCDEEEVFVLCPDYPDLFAIGSLGSLYSLRSNRIVSQTPDGNGYLGHSTKVGGRKGKHIRVRTHIQVAKAFVPNYDREINDEVNHVDGLKNNPRYDNLEWTTHSGNMLHAYATGLAKSEPKRGELHGRSILKDSQALEIRRLKGHEPTNVTAERYAISRKMVNRVQRGELYSHVGE